MTSTRSTSMWTTVYGKGGAVTSAKGFDLSGRHQAEAFINLPEGTKVTLTNGAVGEIVENPHDGAYVLIRYLEHSQDPSKVGQEELVFFNEVKGAE